MLSDWNLVLELEAVDRTVDIVFAWCTSFFTRNYMDFIQALIFSTRRWATGYDGAARPCEQ